MPTPPELISFAGKTRIASGNALDVALQTKAYADGHSSAQVLVFDADTGRQVELDLRGSVEDVHRRVTREWKPEAEPVEEEAPKPGRGRPRLGVAAKEVTLLPRHWDWLARQPGGASVSLRKLVEKAIRDNRGSDLQREMVEALYRFMLAMAGDEAGFEAASRALFAHDMEGFCAQTARWPDDIREHCLQMARSSIGNALSEVEPRPTA